MPDVLSAALSIGDKLIDRLWQDPAKKQEAQLELLKLAQTGELAQLTADTDLAKAQIGVNAVEAASENLFKSGWRPAVGWVCVSALGYQMFLRPLLGWATANLLHWTAAPPSLELDSLMTVLFGILGLGAYRSFDLVKGTRK
jgi:hypothetical protein